MSKNITISLGKEENIKLDELVEFFQKRSISGVNRSDVFKFLLNKTHEIVFSNRDEEVVDFLTTLGMEADFKIDEEDHNIIVIEAEADRD